jgi:hypothetical protein
MNLRQWVENHCLKEELTIGSRNIIPSFFETRARDTGLRLPQPPQVWNRGQLGELRYQLSIRGMSTFLAIGDLCDVNIAS